MKRLIMLAVLCSFVLSAAVASAADIKATGDWVIEAVWKSNWGFDDKGTMKGTAPGTKAFQVQQRARTQFEFIANENLKGVLATAIGTAEWGQDGGAFEVGASAIGIQVRRAYVDFNWPDTSINVKAGYQAVSLPAAIGGGSYILDEEVASAVVGGALTDNVSFLVGYARAFNEAAPDAKTYVDAYVAALPMSFEGFSFNPFGVYAPVGSATDATDLTTDSGLDGLAAINATTNTSGATVDHAYWLGASFTMDMFDPFVLKGDFNYGKVASSLSQNQRSGWLFDLGLEYTGMDMMTPELFFVYTTGEDGNASKGNGSERMPVLAASSWAIGSFYFGGDRLLDGSIGGRNNYLGFWALGLALKDIQSFAEGLTHDINIIYAKGTNDKDSYVASGSATSSQNINLTYQNTLTEKDELWEVDLNSAYTIMDGLTMSLDLGYVNKTTAASRWDGTDGQKGGDAWKVSTGVHYKF